MLSVISYVHFDPKIIVNNISVCCSESKAKVHLNITHTHLTAAAVLCVLFHPVTVKCAPFRYCRAHWHWYSWSWKLGRHSELYACSYFHCHQTVKLLLSKTFITCIIPCSLTITAIELGSCHGLRSPRPQITVQCVATKRIGSSLPAAAVSIRAKRHRHSNNRNHQIGRDFGITQFFACMQKQCNCIWRCDQIASCALPYVRVRVCVVPLTNIICTNKLLNEKF